MEQYVTVDVGEMLCSMNEEVICGHGKLEGIFAMVCLSRVLVGEVKHQ